MNSILLALQFFTSFPVRKELPLGNKEVSSMFMALPFIGAAIGCLLAGVAFVGSDWLGFQPFLTAVLIVLAGIIATGGLHVDGFADAGDAFFSYRDRAKRLEILEDPRLGAFGTLSLVSLLGLKTALFMELLARDAAWLIFVIVPLLARAALVIHFATTPTAKQSGLAHFFKQHFLEARMIGAAVLVGLVGIAGLGLVGGSYGISFVTAGVLALALAGYRKWVLRHFGGTTGDLCGAFVEGMEVITWLVIIVYF